MTCFSFGLHLSTIFLLFFQDTHFVSNGPRAGKTSKLIETFFLVRAVLCEDHVDKASKLFVLAFLINFMSWIASKVKGVAIGEFSFNLFNLGFRQEPSSAIVIASKLLHFGCVEAWFFTNISIA